MSKHETIDDLIIFGSVAKDSMDAKDLDIALMLRPGADARKIKEAVRSAEAKADVQVVDSIYDPLWAILIREGYSVRKKKFLFELYGLEPVVLYRFSLTKLSAVKKVQFERGMKNFLKNTDAKIIARSVALVPMERKGDFDTFLKSWNILYDSQEYELFPIMRKKEI